jgi:hypothetical protein
VLRIAHFRMCSYVAPKRRPRTFTPRISIYYIMRFRQPQKRICRNAEVSLARNQCIPVRIVRSSTTIDAPRPMRRSRFRHQALTAGSLTAERRYSARGYGLLPWRVDRQTDWAAWRMGSAEVDGRARRRGFASCARAARRSCGFPRRSARAAGAAPLSTSRCGRGQAQRRSCLGTLLRS